MEHDVETVTTREKPLDPAQQLDLDIAKAEADLRTATKRASTRRLLNFSLGVLVVIGMPFYLKFVVRIKELTTGTGIMVGVIAAGIYVVYTEVLSRTQIAKQEADLELLQARKRVLGQLPSPATDTGKKDYFDALVTINVDNLAGYYSLVKTHTNKSFMVALAMGIAGFLLLATGLALGFSNNQRSDLMTYISTGAGVLTEFIAAVFFYLYNRTIRQMKGYHDSLLDVQNVLLALKLVGDTEQSPDRIKMIGQMMGYLLASKRVVEREEAEVHERERAKPAEEL